MSALQQKILAKRRRLNDSNSAPRIPRNYIAESHFTYEFVAPSSLAPAAVATLSVNTDQDGDFYWHKGCVFVDAANDGTTYDAQLCPNLTVLITDGTTQRNLSNVAVHVSNLFGVGRMPFILPAPYYFAARALITMQVTNVSDNATYTSLRLSMHGIKRFLGN